MGYQIIVVDDSKVIRKRIREMLSPCDDLDVIEALDGLVGIETIQAHQPNIILLDFILPKLKGLYSYNQTHDYETLNTVKWSLQTKHANRLKRLKQRAMKHYGFPLFWMEFFQDCVAQKPEYYGVVNI